MTKHIADEVRELIASARINYLKAYEFEQAAADRAESIRKRELGKLRDSAEAGNAASKTTLKQIQVGEARGFQVNVDTIASNDTIWKAHVANNQFFTRKANLDNLMAQTIMMAKGMDII